MTEISVPATEFKAKCLKLMDEVRKGKLTVVITKHGRPVARLSAVTRPRPASLFGALKGSVVVKGDIVSPIDVKWEALE